MSVTWPVGSKSAILTGCLPSRTRVGTSAGATGSGSAIPAVAGAAVDVRVCCFRLTASAAVIMIGNGHAMQYVST